MSYKVLARKWRPQKFRDVIGQKHITLTLQNAIQKDRVGHAYLFVGPRGIGKTTTARIFAKALNCLNPEIDDAGKIEPCSNCETCKEIATGNCLDVIEIDGASHNKVEDIRGLRDTVPYAPTHGRKFKIYVIDEVHMLTTGAWNALLKTLEEPPPHVKFLFATTEAHKVLPTIVSRCQRFDLKRISVPLIVEQLRKIADSENILIDDSALAVIARAADGGMRDAQSIFDQMIAFCGGDDPDSRISEKDVVDVFGLTSTVDLKRLVISLLDNQPVDVISTIHYFADSGRNLERLYVDLLSYLRNLIIFQFSSNPEFIVEMSDSELEDYKALAKKSSPATTQRLIEELMTHESKVRNFLNKRMFIEVTLLRAMRDAHSPSVDELITALRRIREENGQLGSASIDQSGINKIHSVSMDKNPPSDDWQPSTTSQTQEAKQTYDNKSPEKENLVLELNDKQGTAPDKRVAHYSGDNNSGTKPSTATIPSVQKKTPKTDDHQLQEKKTCIHSDPVETHEQALTLEVEAANTDDPSAEQRGESIVQAVSQTSKPHSRKEIWESLEKNEFVESVCKIFNGTIVDVRG